MNIVPRFLYRNRAARSTLACMALVLGLMAVPVMAFKVSA